MFPGCYIFTSFDTLHSVMKNNYKDFKGSLSQKHKIYYISKYLFIIFPLIWLNLDQCWHIPVLSVFGVYPNFCYNRSVFSSTVLENTQKVNKHINKLSLDRLKKFLLTMFSYHSLFVARSNPSMIVSLFSVFLFLPISMATLVNLDALAGWRLKSLHQTVGLRQIPFTWYRSEC